MWSLVTLVSAFYFLQTIAAQGTSPPPIVGRNGWSFVQNGTSGVIALEEIIVSPTLAIFFDRPGLDPIMIDGHPTWGALWNFETNTATPLRLTTNTFCASGALLSNGSMVSVGGTEVLDPISTPNQDGRMSVRIFEPCASPSGDGCQVIENPETMHLAETRWYTSAIRIFDGSLMIIGGIHEATLFYNTDPVNSFEFFPSKDGGVPRPSEFLERSLPTNLFPRAFALPDGRVFMVANNRSIIYDIERNVEITLPDIPNGVRVTNPMDGSAALLPLSPPLYEPEVLVCGGSATDDRIQPANLSTQIPASTQCSRIKLTPDGIRRGWQVEHMLEPRTMPELLLIPNGQILITNGAMSGFAALASVGDAEPTGSNADHPALTPSLYTPNAPLGRRISNDGMPTTNIARVYHSSATLTPMGNIMLAGSDPNAVITQANKFPSEFRVEFLNPPFMNALRPSILSAPAKISFNSRITLQVSIPSNLRANSIQVSLMDLGFSSHAFHSSQRLVFLTATLSRDRRSLSVLTPPNNRVFPPGPAFLFLTIDDVTSKAVHFMVGTGGSPPVRDQGIRI